MLPTIFLTLTIAAPPQLPVSTLPPLPDSVTVELVAAPVVIQEQLPPLESRRSDDRIAELERRVAALEAAHAKLGLPVAPPASMPVPAGYQRTATATTSYVATSSFSGDAGACANGSCGTPSAARFTPFNGRFRRR